MEERTELVNKLVTGTEVFRSENNTSTYQKTVKQTLQKDSGKMMLILHLNVSDVVTATQNIIQAASVKSETPVTLLTCTLQKTDTNILEAENTRTPTHPNLENT